MYPKRTTVNLGRLVDEYGRYINVHGELIENPDKHNQECDSPGFKNKNMNSKRKES